jgi:concentrative nucleoside transporter, CNT family
LERFIAVIGISFLLGVAVAFSSARRSIQWKTVGIGLFLQLLFAWLVLRVEIGQTALAATAAAVTWLLGYADEGSRFVFGPLVDGVSGSTIFAFKVLPIVIFISSLFSCLYYLGVMQWVVAMMARVMTRFMGVSGAESLAASANVFMGQTEAPIIIAPYVPQMTLSELMALMTGGMATVSGAVLGGYIAMGVDPGYLLSASIMAAPASLAVAKILVPEVGTPLTAGTVRIKAERTDSNLIDAAARGAGRGVQLAINIAAMLIAFIALVALGNAVLGGMGRWLGVSAWLGQEISFQLLLGYLLAPAAFLLGVPWVDATTVGQLIGTKLILNEFVAFVDFVELREGLTDKSRLIATYALCGFANLGSIGIQIGGIGGLAPDRRGDLARLGLKAVLGGTIASLLTASVAGLLA